MPRAGVAGAEWKRCWAAECRQGRSGPRALDVRNVPSTAAPLALFTDVLLLRVLLAWERSFLALIFMFPHCPVRPGGLHQSQQRNKFFTKSIFLLTCQAEGNGEQPTSNCGSWLQIATLLLSDKGQRREKFFAHH